MAEPPHLYIEASSNPSKALIQEVQNLCRSFILPLEPLRSTTDHGMQPVPNAQVNWFACGTSTSTATSLRSCHNNILLW